MKLRSMRETDYAHWMPRLRTSYIHDKIRANGYTLEEATDVADEGLQRLLPHGLQTKGHLFFVGEEDDQAVGYAWIHLHSIGGELQAFIYDIIISDEFQGRGLGRGLMMGLENEARKKGASRMALHVFGFNDRAIRLYQSLGYLTTDLSMEKRL